MGFRVSCMEAKVLWRDLYGKGNDFSLSFSSLFAFYFSLTSLICSFLLFLCSFMFRVHARRLQFHGGTSIRKVMDFPFLSPPSSHFYFTFSILIWYCLFLSCRCTFNREIRKNDILGAIFNMQRWLIGVA